MFKRIDCSAEGGTGGNERTSLQKEEKDETWRLA